MNQIKNVRLFLTAMAAIIIGMVLGKCANGQGFGPPPVWCPPNCPPGVIMPVPPGPYVPNYPPLRFQRPYGPGVDMPMEGPAPFYRPRDLYDEFQEWRNMPLYPPPRRR
jgi:hypothetical protein